MWRAIRHKAPFKKAPQPLHQQSSWIQRIPARQQKGHACHSWAVKSFGTCFEKIPFSWRAHITMQKCSDLTAGRTCSRQFDMTLSAHIVAVEAGACRILLTIPGSPAGFLHTDTTSHTHMCTVLRRDGKWYSIPHLYLWISLSYFSMFLLKYIHFSISWRLHPQMFACTHHSIPSQIPSSHSIQVWSISSYSKRPLFTVSCLRILSTPGFYHIPKAKWPKETC